MKNALILWVSLATAALLLAISPDLASAGNGKGGGKKPPPPPDDSTAPGQVQNLDVSAVTATTVTLEWFRAADDGYDCGSGPASSYDLRYLIDTPVDESNWAAATPTAQVPDPSTPTCDGGTPLPEDPFKVLGLLPLTVYHFAIKAIDEAGNASPISSDLSVTTMDDGWTIEIVPTQGSNNPTLVFDPGDGNPSIAYRGGGSEKFAHFDGVDWVITDLGASSGGHDLVYLSAGTPAMSYRVKAAKKKDGQIIMYALWNSSMGDFDSPETVATGAAALSTSIAFDGSGNASIVYMEDGPQGEDLIFAIRGASDWDNPPEVIDGQMFVRAPDLAYDPSGNASVAYEAELSDDSHEIRFAVRSASGWDVPMTVDSAPDPDQLRYPSLAYDVGNQPAISYAYGDLAGGPSPGDQVLVARHDAFSGWLPPESLPHVSVGYSDTSLVFDLAGTIYVAFAATYQGDCSENDVQVWFDDGSGWVPDVVTELPFCPNGVSLALDPNGGELPAVAIKDKGNGVLKFAQKNPNP